MVIPTIVQLVNLNLAMLIKVHVFNNVLLITLLLMENVKLVILNVMDAESLVLNVLNVLLDIISWVLHVLKLAILTCLLIMPLTFVSLAMKNVKLAQVSPSVPLVPILKLYPSMVFVTIVPILAILAPQLLQVAPHVLMDSISLELLVLLLVPLEPSQETEFVFAEVELFSEILVLLHAQLDMEILVVNAKNVMRTVPVARLQRPTVFHVLMAMLWIKSVDCARKLLHVNSANISHNHRMLALEFAHPTLTSMKMFA
eukprot:TRINITY_DN4503_c0_g1_i1.p2 TRINITY_DN4503_c0_g1~~TRINITY_DN4503_c0_g1_i1.p2  ORF type:complete len:257 (+),score=29.37 TRINITY_DN4503_c0_g1_i1:2781-3551(+)